MAPRSPWDAVQDLRETIKNGDVQRASIHLNPARSRHQATLLALTHEERCALLPVLFANGIAPTELDGDRGFLKLAKNRAVLRRFYPKAADRSVAQVRSAARQVAADFAGTVQASIRKVES